MRRCGKGARLGSWRLKLVVHESSFVRSRYQRANGERSRRKDAGRSPLVMSATVATFFAAVAARGQTAPASRSGEGSIHLDPVVVTATRLAEPMSEVPAAISVVDQSDIQDARRTVGLDEPLNRVPGVFIQNSDNFAQDFRVQIRGFGARSVFGIRDVRVLVDGLPETLPDGQTELDAVDLGAVQRIEVLRGPASSLYGNASGGVIQLFTEDGPDTPSAEVRLTGGSFGLGKYQIKGGGHSGNVRVFIQGSYLQLDGFRDQSATRAGTVNAKLRYDFDDRTDVTLLLNGVESPTANDAGGLTRAEADADPSQATQRAIQLNTGESVEQGRLGAVAHHRFDSGELSSYAYGLYRDFQTRQPIPPTTPAEQGGFVVFHRFSPGGGVRYLFDEPLLGWAQKFTAGFDAQYQADERERLSNNNGQRGPLGLHQHERVTGVGPYVREAVSLTENLEVSGGARYDNVHYAVDVDVPPNSGESGSRTLDAWSPAGGVRYSPRQWLSLYGNVGTAFQTPTTTELANPNGAGFNPDLTPQHATSYELGGRTEWERLRAGLAAFYLDVTDVLTPFELPAQPGRTFFRNAGRSQRYGFEGDWQATLLPQVRWTSALTLIQARLLGGADEPGIPQWQVYQELAYRHQTGVFVALEAFLVDGYYVDDGNTARAHGFELCNLRAGYEHQVGDWTIGPFVGLNNLTDTHYDARVRINATGGRFFEPSAGFNVYGGLTISAML